MLSDEVFDIAVDARQASLPFGRHVGMFLDADERQQQWIPAGFAQGFRALTDEVAFRYKCTESDQPVHETTIHWDDLTVEMAWPAAPALLWPRDEARPLAAPSALLPVDSPADPEEAWAP